MSNIHPPSGTSPLKIFLTGMPGSGKSGLGRRVAGFLNITWLDTDDLVVSKYGKTIDAIFNEEGEAVFRQREKDVLREVLKDTVDCVVSTGGGLPCFEHNMDMMLNSGIVIYLDVPVGILAERISKSRERPMFAGQDQNTVREKLVHMLEERYVFYERAHLIIHNNMTWAAIKSDILYAVRKYMN